jgi:uncharacterized SAM-binding protein YcdF (DUF218 family)
MSFALSKILWMFLSPGNLLVILLGIGLWLGSSSRPSVKNAGGILSLCIFFCFATIAVLPVGTWALTPLENRFAFKPPSHIDGIIVIGGDEQPEISAARGQPVALDSMRRYVRFADMALRYPDAKLVFSGGPGRLVSHSFILDSEVAEQILGDIGVPTDRMTFESKSRNTYENAVFSADIVKPEASQNWLLVTSAFHMPRAMGCFRKAGWNVYAAPTGYFTTGKYRGYTSFNLEEQMLYLSLATHEYAGLVSYWLMGRTNALWPE